jgi:hypothetical protein
VYVAGEPGARHALAAALRRAGVCAVEDLDAAPPFAARLRERAAAAGCDRLVSLAGAHARMSDLGGDAAGAPIDAATLAAFISGRAPLDAVLPARYVAAPAGTPTEGWGDRRPMKRRGSR